MSVFDNDTLTIERVLATFETGWSAEASADLNAFIPTDQSQDLQQRLLWELVESDLELRIKSGLPVQVEHYLRRFPQLAEDRKRLADLVGSEYRLRARREPGLKPDEIERRFPELADVLSLGGSSTASTTAPPRGMNGSPAAVGELTAHGSRFRLLRPHDEGGLGKLWLAYDNELKREVALKEIRQKYADDEVSRIRFATEAMVTSSLEHPGIVPVYGFGHYNDGRPITRCGSCAV